MAFDRFGEPDRIEPLLRERHEQRARSDLEFRLLAEEYQELLELGRQEEVSLNLERRRAERDELARRREARRQARIAAGLAEEGEAQEDDGLLADERPIAAEEGETDLAEALTRDPLAREAARILADAIELLERDAALAKALPFELATGHGTDPGRGRRPACGQSLREPVTDTKDAVDVAAPGPISWVGRERGSGSRGREERGPGPTWPRWSRRSSGGSGQGAASAREHPQPAFGASRARCAVLPSGRRSP
ncbi:MAG: carboxy terminal-processing peptidase [Xanthomonadales bacterium]|nr:carboxy terminal-processing peptidase [Xanthomonadales bacterium]